MASVKGLPTLRKGAESDTVYAMQVLLAGYGYLQGRYVNGKFDGHTETAVRDYQKDHTELSVDGICGPMTWGSLLGV